MLGANSVESADKMVDLVAGEHALGGRAGQLPSG